MIGFKSDAEIDYWIAKQLFGYNNLEIIRGAVMGLPPREKVYKCNWDTNKA